MFARDEDYVTKVVETDEQTAELPCWSAYRVGSISLSDGEVTNDGVDTETISIEVVDGLEVARGSSTASAPILNVSGTATIEIDGAAVSVAISSGTGTKEVTSTKSAGSTISVEVVEIDVGPIEPDTAEIEVVSA